MGLSASAERAKPKSPIIASALPELKASGPKTSAAAIGNIKMCRLVFFFLAMVVVIANSSYEWMQLQVTQVQVTWVRVAVR
jgi:hypothetical protein